VAVERTSPGGWVAELQWRRGLPLRSQRVRGDAAALTAVYERHHQALYRYCRSILRDEEEARDALQSTMAKALAALRDEQRDFEVRPWLFRIAHNEAISRLRRRREVADPEAVAAASTDSLAQTVEDRERLAHLRTDLHELPERQRAALVLRELSGLSHEEIASVLDTTARAVKQTIFEARLALQECAEGRAMLCVDVQRALSDGDGRVLRGRRLRSHVRSCRSCRQFKAALSQRPADLAALAPGLPAAAGTALLAHLLPKAGLASGAGAAATGVGGGVAGTVATKAAIVVAATVTLAGTTTAVRSVVEPSHHARSAPARTAPAQHPRAVPASAAPSTTHALPSSGTLHRAGTHRSAHEHATTAGASAHHAAGKAGAGKAKGKLAHKAPPGQSKAAASNGRGKSQAAPGHTKAYKAAKPVKPAKATRTHPTHPAHPGSASASAPAADGAGTPPVAAGKGNTSKDAATATPAGAALGNKHVSADSP
jgi:RNA polymerase sigma factor (sigma-70 family)